MKGKRTLVMAGVLALLLSVRGGAATFSLSGPNQTGNTIKVAPGATFTVSVLMNAPEEVGNTFEVFLGYDVSDATKHGLVGSPTQNKLTLVGLPSIVANTIDSDFAVYRSAKLGTARESNNTALGGRPYGLKVVGARSFNTIGGQRTLFSATFQNNIPAGESASIVLSDAGSGASFTTGWKHGFTTHRGGYVLQVSSVASQIPGDANNDGMVDVGDLGILAANYGTASGATWGQGDFNDDGAVDVGDLGILAAHYGEGVEVALDFNADYAKAFGITMDGEDGDTQTALTCPMTGLPLIAGIFLMGIMMIGSLRVKE